MSSIGFLLKGPSFETQSRKDRRNNTRKAGSYNDLLHYYVSSFAFFSLIIPFFFSERQSFRRHTRLSESLFEEELRTVANLRRSIWRWLNRGITSLEVEGKKNKVDSFFFKNKSQAPTNVLWPRPQSRDRNIFLLLARSRRGGMASSICEWDSFFFLFFILLTCFVL